jgi:N-acetylmuramic acid 6-phosphate etherase
LRSLGFTGALTVIPDLYAGLYAREADPLVFLVCGTGSVVAGRRGQRVERTGGWGPLLGDPASGLELGRLAALRLTGRLEAGRPLGKNWSGLLAARFPEASGDPARLRALCASSEALAGLAQPLLEEAQSSKELQEVIRGQLRHLAQQAWQAAQKLGKGKALGDFQVLASGGLLHSQLYRYLLEEALLEVGLPAPVILTEKDRFLGLARLAKLSPKLPEETRVDSVEAVSPTELDNPFSQDLDRLEARGIVELMLSESRRQVDACRIEKEALSRSVVLASEALGRGGRVIYVGAGTSGRVGVLDASESPPTFHVDPSRICGVIAGGKRAVFEAVEGAEDSAKDGAAALDALSLKACDLVVGIAASGSTPYVLGALRRAREVGAATVLVSSHPRAPARGEVDVFVGLPTGPEVLRGSTRLNAGGAAKLVLNILTTGAWVLQGKCYGNYMVDLRQTSSKLVRRARRIFRELTQSLEPVPGEELLTAAGGRVKTAVLMAFEGLDREQAEAQLEAAGGHLGELIGPPRRRT